MKKLLLVLIIGAFTACNDSATSTEKPIDSTVNATVDSLRTRGDSSTKAIGSTTEKSEESIKSTADSIKKK